MTTEKLRDAIAGQICEPGESGWRVGLDRADAILALPEMVAAMGADKIRLPGANSAESDVELAAEYVAHELQRAGLPPTERRIVGLAVAALAAAGRLLPTGGVERVEFAHKPGHLVHSHRCPDSALTRTVTKWPDGNEWRGPWVSVNEGSAE